MGQIEDRLSELGIKPGEALPPVGNYVGTKRAGNLLFVSGRKSELRGIVGDDVTEMQAKEAARDTLLDQLAIIKADIHDLDLVEGVIKLNGFIRAAPDFYRLPEVLDSASQLLIDLWGDRGRHSRLATGVSQTPFGAALQLEMILLMR